MESQQSEAVSAVATAAVHVARAEQRSATLEQVTADIAEQMLTAAEIANQTERLIDVKALFNVSPIFYRAMHYSAKPQARSRPPVCPSVTLVDCDHTGWKTWQLIARTISPKPSLFVAQRPSTYSKGNMGKFGGDEVGWGKKTPLSLTLVRLCEET